MARAPHEIPTITVGQLRSQLAGFDDDWTLDFGGLAFYRIKPRDFENKHAQCEFSQPVYLDRHTGRVIVENPDIDTADDGNQ